MEMEAQKDIAGSHEELKKSGLPRNEASSCTTSSARASNIEKGISKSNRTSPQLQERTRCVDFSAADSCIKGAAKKIRVSNKSCTSESDENDDDDVVGALIYNSSLTAQSRAALARRSHHLQPTDLEPSEQECCKNEGGGPNQEHQLDNASANKQASFLRSIHALQHQTTSSQGGRRENLDVNEGNEGSIAIPSSARNSDNSIPYASHGETALSTAAEKYRAQSLSAALHDQLNKTGICNLGASSTGSIQVGGSNGNVSMPSLDAILTNEVLSKLVNSSGNNGRGDQDWQKLVEDTQRLVESATADAVGEILGEIFTKSLAPQPAGVNTYQPMLRLIQDLASVSNTRKGRHQENTLHGTPTVSGRDLQRELALPHSSTTSRSSNSSVSHQDLVSLIIDAYAPLPQPQPRLPWADSPSVQPELCEPGTSLVSGSTHAHHSGDNTNAKMLSDVLKATDTLLNTRVSGNARNLEEHLEMRVRELVERYPQILEESSMNEIKRSFFRRIMLLSEYITHCCNQQFVSMHQQGAPRPSNPQAMAGYSWGARNGLPSTLSRANMPSERRFLGNRMDLSLQCNSRLNLSANPFHHEEAGVTRTDTTKALSEAGASKKSEPSYFDRK